MVTIPLWALSALIVISTLVGGFFGFCGAAMAFKRSVYGKSYLDV